MIGNCETEALVNPDGGIDWLCLPVFDAPSLFGALLDPDNGGEFYARPAGDYRVERQYLDGTADSRDPLHPRGRSGEVDRIFVIARPARAGPDHEKFKRSVGPTIGLSGVIAGFWRAPRTFRLLFSKRSKWPGREP